MTISQVYTPRVGIDIEGWLFVTAGRSAGAPLLSVWNKGGFLWDLREKRWQVSIRKCWENWEFLFQWENH